MSILGIVKRLFPDTSGYFISDVAGLKTPRYMLSGDILHWQDLRTQINPNTGKINSYRDIRKIVVAEGGKPPSLGSLRNYLGSGGEFRTDIAKTEWKDWFERFGRLTEWYKEEIEGTTTPEEWEDFRLTYTEFFGY